MVEQSVPADSVSALRESALAAAGVRGIFTNLIDGKSVGARNTLDVLIPPPASCSPKCPTLTATEWMQRSRPPAEPFPPGAN